MNNNLESYTWTWDDQNQVVVLTEHRQQRVTRYTVESIEQAAANVKQSKHTYATEDAYIVQLNKFNAGISVARARGGSVEQRWIDQTTGRIY